MKFIAHRINTIAELKEIPSEYGVEVDLRDFGNRIVLQHEPFLDGEDFAGWLEHYRHDTLILNIKSERIEFWILELLKKHQIENYFFLDCSFPMIVQLMQNGETNIALRFSEWEGLDTLLALRGKARWVWVDCFTKLPLDQKAFRILKEAGFKICLVSPEVLGRPQDLLPYQQFLSQEGIELDAVCAKRDKIDQWIHAPKR